MKKLLLFLALFSVPLLAQEVSTDSFTLANNATQEYVELDELSVAVIDFVKDIKGMGKLGVAVALVSILMQLLKTKLLTNFLSKKNPMYKRVLLVVLGQVLAVLLSLESGMVWQAALWQGLIVSGGAVILFETIKPLLKKKEPES